MLVMRMKSQTGKTPICLTLMNNLIKNKSFNNQLKSQGAKHEKKSKKAQKIRKPLIAKKNWVPN